MRRMQAYHQVMTEHEKLFLWTRILTFCAEKMLHLVVNIKNWCFDAITHWKLFYN